MDCEKKFDQKLKVFNTIKTINSLDMSDLKKVWLSHHILSELIKELLDKISINSKEEIDLVVAIHALINFSEGLGPS